MRRQLTTSRFNIIKVGQHLISISCITLFHCSQAADGILQQVNGLIKKLSDARSAQNDSREAIAKAQDDVEMIRDSLKMVSQSGLCGSALFSGFLAVYTSILQVGDITTAAIKKAKDLADFGEKLLVRATEIGYKSTANSHHVGNAIKQANSAKDNADMAEKVMNEFQKLSLFLHTKANC